MGLCSSKRPTRRDNFNPTGSATSQRSYVSSLSTRRLNPSNNDTGVCEEISDIRGEENDLPDKFEVEHYLLGNVWDNTLFSSPIGENLKTGNLNVLDVVCGPGHWIQVTALEFSQSKFTGIHASPTCKLQIPRNALVLRINILGDINYPDNSFDYVHMRVLSPKFTDSQWQEIVSQMARLTKPGGYCEIEVGDYEEFENEGPLMKKMIDARRKCLEECGIKMNVLDDLVKIMKDTCRFSSVQKQSRSIPIGGKSMGKFSEMASKHFTRIMSSQGGHISSYLGQALEDFNNNMSELDQYRSTCLRSVRAFGRKIEI